MEEKGTHSIQFNEPKFVGTDLRFDFLILLSAYTLRILCQAQQSVTRIAMSLKMLALSGLNP